MTKNVTGNNNVGPVRAVKRDMGPNINSTFVLKYFDLINDFVKISVQQDKIRQSLATQDIGSKQKYHEALVKEATEWDAIEEKIRELDDDYDLDIAIELLYQIVVDANPSLEIHQVSLPDSAQKPKESGRSSPEPLSTNFRDRALTLESVLKHGIIGQDSAIDSIARTVRYESVIRLSKGPIAVLFFAGPTGCGKTETAKLIQEHLFAPGKLIKVSGGEYALPHEYAKLIGAPPGYIGHNEGGYLTEAIRKEPKSVVLFDEIEKAHYKVHNIMLDLLEEGTITDSKGVLCDFKQSIVIMTSNVGVEKFAAASDRVGFGRGQPLADNLAEECLRQAMKETFRPEFLGRIAMVPFTQLKPEHCVAIATKKIGDFVKSAANQGYSISVSPAVSRRFGIGVYSPEYGARGVNKEINSRLLNPIRDFIIDRDIHPGEDSPRIIVTMKKDELHFRVEERAKRTSSDTEAATHNPLTQATMPPLRAAMSRQK